MEKLNIKLEKKNNCLCDGCKFGCERYYFGGTKPFCIVFERFVLAGEQCPFYLDCDNPVVAPPPIMSVEVAELVIKEFVK